MKGPQPSTTTPPTTTAPTTTPAPTPPAPPAAGGATTTPPASAPPRSGPPPGAPPASGAPATAAPPAGAPPVQGAPSTAPAGTPPQGAIPGNPYARRAPPQVTTPLPTVTQPTAAQLRPLPGGPNAGGQPTNLSSFRGQRQEVQQGGRTVYTEPGGRMIIRDPSGQSFVRHNEVERFRYGARDIRTETIRGETRTVVFRPDGSQIITVIGNDGRLLRRSRRDGRGREIIIIDNSYRDPRSVGGYYVDLPPPMIRIPRDRYIVEAGVASAALIYETMMAPPVDRVERRYSLEEIRYSPSVRQLMPSIDLDTIVFETGSWEIPPDQAAKLQTIADGLNQAIQRNPREVFLIEGHTDKVGSDVDNLSLSDRRAESAATLLTQQFGVPAENLTSQGYGEQYPKEQTDGPSLINRRVTVRRITPLLNGGQAALPPPPPGVGPR
jgi:OmpA-OmpF porin, OOP family